MAPQKNATFSEDIDEKNRIRKHLTSFFRERDCFTMVRPHYDEEKLQQLDKVDMGELRGDFVEQVMKFRKRVIMNIKVKTLEGQKLNG